MKFNSERFAQMLRLRQYEKRLNVTAAAKEIGISKATLSRLNREKGLPDVYTYFLCCKWLERDMIAFFN